MSLRTRLLAGLAVLVFAAVATAGWSVLAVARVKLHEAEDARASVIGMQMAALVQRACAQSCRAGDVAEVARTLVDGGATAELVVVDTERRLLVGAGDVRSTQAVADPRLGSALAGIPSLTRSGDALYYYAPLRTQAGRPAGALRVRMPGDAEVDGALHGARMLLVG